MPTMCTVTAMLNDEAFASRVPDQVRAKYEEVRLTLIEAVKAAREVGVKLAMGTDIGTPGNHAGENMQELEVMVDEGGCSPIEAIRSATIHGAEVCSRGDDLGVIEGGRIADIIACPENPLDDIRALRNVNFVMKDGKIFRDDAGLGPGVENAGL